MIKRIDSRQSFTCVTNDIINDKRLDWKELGLLIYLLSKPDNWTVHTNQLVKERNLGRDGVRMIMKKLQECGYMGYHRDSGGKTYWWVSEKPQTDNPYKGVEKPQTEKPHVENPVVLVNTDCLVNTDIKTTTSRKSKKHGQQDMEMAEGMLSLIRAINPHQKQPNMDSWANTIRLMVERDGIPYQEIARVFQWANEDNFWKSNILSPEKLRKQFDQLTIRSKQDGKSNQTPAQTRNDIHRNFYEKVALTGDLGSSDFREDADTLRTLMDEASRREREGNVESDNGVVGFAQLLDG